MHKIFLGLSLGLAFASGQKIADPETTTPHGCKCTSLCGATIFDGFKSDWCKVDGDCGEYSFKTGYWDYCLYKACSKPQYQDWDWRRKQE